MRAGVAVALLAIGVGLTAWCTAGLVLARDPLARLHYMTPASTVAAFALALALAAVFGEHRIPPSPVTRALRRLHQGDIGAYATWLFVGLAGLVAAFAYLAT